jgi:hypothetical protein
MLGYKITDIVDMQIAINEAVHYIPADDAETKRDLYKAFDFLQGLIVEGHVL